MPVLEIVYGGLFSIGLGILVIFVGSISFEKHRKFYTKIFKKLAGKNYQDYWPKWYIDNVWNASWSIKYSKWGVYGLGGILIIIGISLIIFSFIY